jgi:hypothetical protein
MHPNRRDQNQVKMIAQFSSLIKVWQLVVNPLNAFVFGGVLAKLPQTSRRLHRDHIPTALCQSRSISAAAGADVQRKAGFAVQLGQPVAVDLFKDYGLVLAEIALGVLAIGGYAHY